MISLSGTSISVLPAVVFKIFSYQWNCLKNWSPVVSSLLLTTMVQFSWHQEGTFSWFKKPTEARCCLWIGTEFCTKHIDHLVFIYPQTVLGNIAQKYQIHHCLLQGVGSLPFCWCILEQSRQPDCDSYCWPGWFCKPVILEQTPWIM